MRISILKKAMTGLLASAVIIGSTLALLPRKEASASSLFELSGTAHIQDTGNVTAEQDGSGLLKLGTRGQSKRLEAITINLVNNSGVSGSLEYRVHVQDIGWMDWTPAGSKAGTEGQAKRLEGIEIRLTGDLASCYAVEYSAHIQNYGDNQGAVCDGALAGTTGESKRVEEIRIKIVERTSYTSMGIKYRTHIQDQGWENTWAEDGSQSGTTGKSRRLEAISITLTGAQYQGGIKYKTHIQDYGWQTDVANGEMSGTQGKSKRLEAITIELTGDVAEHYDVYYRVHVQDIGWMNWAKNGEKSGTSGGGKRLESIQIVLVAKGTGNPGNVSGIAGNYSEAFKELLPNRYQFFDFRARYRTNGALVGMDVSAYQGNVDWKAVKNAGVDFVILRLARCSSTTQVMAFDTYFLKNYQAAKDAGLLVGAYYYCTRGDSDSVIADTNAICDFLEQNNITLDFPVGFDWEEYEKMQQWGIPDTNALNALWKTFIDTMAGRGYDVMIYSSKWYLEHYWNTYDKMVWVANWVPQTTYRGEYHLWQVTSTGECDGIKGIVDLDIYYPMGHKAYTG